MISSCSEKAGHPPLSHYSIVFSWLYSFSWNTFFYLYSFSVPTIKEEWVVEFKGNLRHAIQNHWMSSNSVACSQRWRLCFVLFCLELFLAHPNWFLLVMACSELFCFLQATTSQNVLIRKFTINQLHFRFY